MTTCFHVFIGPIIILFLVKSLGKLAVLKNILASQSRRNNIQCQKPVSAYYSSELLHSSDVIEHEKSKRQLKPPRKVSSCCILVLQSRIIAHAHKEHKARRDCPSTTRRHGTLNKCCSDVDPPSTALDQRYGNNCLVHRVCWAWRVQCQTQNWVNHSPAQCCGNNGSTRSIKVTKMCCVTSSTRLQVFCLNADKTLVERLFNDGPASTTLGRRWTNIQLTGSVHPPLRPALSYLRQSCARVP